MKKFKILILFFLLFLISCNPKSSGDKADEIEGKSNQTEGSEVILVDLDPVMGEIIVHKKWDFPNTLVEMYGSFLILTPNIHYDPDLPIEIIGLGTGFGRVQVTGSGPGGTCVTTSNSIVTLEMQGFIFAHPACMLQLTLVDEVWSLSNIKDECNGQIIIDTMVDELMKEYKK